MNEITRVICTTVTVYEVNLTLLSPIQTLEGFTLSENSHIRGILILFIKTLKITVLCRSKNSGQHTRHAERINVFLSRFSAKAGPQNGTNFVKTNFSVAFNVLPPLYLDPFAL